jgi:hypothetical protein
VALNEKEADESNRGLRSAHNTKDTDPGGRICRDLMLTVTSGQAYEANDDWPSSGYCPGSKRMVRNVSTDCSKTAKAGKKSQGNKSARQIQK